MYKELVSVSRNINAGTCIATANTEPLQTSLRSRARRLSYKLYVTTYTVLCTIQYCTDCSDQVLWTLRFVFLSALHLRMCQKIVLDSTKYCIGVLTRIPVSIGNILNFEVLVPDRPH